MAYPTGIFKTRSQCCWKMHVCHQERRVWSLLPELPRNIRTARNTSKCLSKESSASNSADEAPYFPRLVLNCIHTDYCFPRVNFTFIFQFIYVAAGNRSKMLFKELTKVPSTTRTHSNENAPSTHADTYSSSRRSQHKHQHMDFPEDSLHSLWQIDASRHSHTLYVVSCAETHLFQLCNLLATGVFSMLGWQVFMDSNTQHH